MPCGQPNAESSKPEREAVGRKAEVAETRLRQAEGPAALGRDS